MTDIASKTIEPPRIFRRVALAGAIAPLLIPAGDFPIFGYAPGINVELFLALLAAGIVALSWQQANRRVLAIGVASSSPACCR